MTHGFVLTWVLFAGSCTAPSRDADHDGIPDDLEQRLAQQLFPVLHVSPIETCPQPLAPKPVLFRARHPAFRGIPDENYVVINYVVLYDEDCGGPPHAGDNEPLVVFARKSGNGQYAFDSVAATAHTNTPMEVRTSSWQRDIWIQPYKHSNFAQYDDCSRCDRTGLSWDIALFNVGEPASPLMSDLGVIRRAYSGINPWSTVTRFLGAGVIGEDLNLRAFNYVTHPPALLACVQQCSTRKSACERDDCVNDTTSCVSACWTSSSRWDD